MKDTSKITQEENTGEAFVRVLEELLNVNYRIFEIIDARLNMLEDQVEVLEKKKGN